jgi:hypothetical protein
MRGFLAVLTLGAGLALATSPTWAQFPAPQPFRVPLVQIPMDTRPETGTRAVPVVQGDAIAVGGTGQQPIVPPSGKRFTEAVATSLDSAIVQITEVDEPVGGPWAFHFVVRRQGVSLVTVTWRNPSSNEALEQYFVLASGVRVDSAEVVTLTKGQVMIVTLPQVVQANARFANYRVVSARPPVKADAQDTSVQMTAQDAGTSLVTIELPRDRTGTPHVRVLIVAVSEPVTG